MSLDRADVEHIATLARIGLTDNELAMFQQQLSQILEQFAVLREVDTTGVAPTGHAVELQAVMRDDSPQECLTPEEVLLNAPRREGQFFQVKAVLEE